MDRTLGFAGCALTVFLTINCCISIGLIPQPNLRLIPEVELTSTPTAVVMATFPIPATGCCCCVPCDQPHTILNTPVPPRPTAPTCFEILDARDDLTSAQWENLLDDVRRSRIDGWSGTVMDVSRELTLKRAYRVSLALDDDCSLAFTIKDKDLALSLQRGQVLTISGPVQYAYLNVSDYLVITLPDDAAAIQ